MILNSTEELIEAAKIEAKKTSTPIQNVLQAYQIRVLAIIAETIFLNGVRDAERGSDREAN